jgi:hypothetical protein
VKRYDEASTLQAEATALKDEASSAKYGTNTYCTLVGKTGLNSPYSYSYAIVWYFTDYMYEWKKRY